jgi:hypothetical protein
VIQAARKRGLPVRCVWLSTSLEDAQVNAAWRMMSKYNRLLGPEEMRRATKQDVSAFGPTVQFRYQRELEPPNPSEGFSRIDTIPIDRTREVSFTNRALILWCDGLLLRSRSGLRAPASRDDVEVDADHADVLRRYAADGWRLVGLSWKPEIAADMRALLGVPIEVLYCPHAGGPPTCWCRKPLPGLGVVLIHRHRLDPLQCIYVGAGGQDPGFARRLGFRYVEASNFFEGPAAT